MNSSLAEPARSAQGHPLLIKQLLASGLARAPDQEIVHADKSRWTYREFAERLGRLATGLASLGVRPQDTVGVMDWDTHRYLECFFAIPMMGAVLHTINVRLPPEQILHTINHADDDIILVNVEFIPILEQIWHRVDIGKRLVLLEGDAPAAATQLRFAAEYEDLIAESDSAFDFPDLDESTRATTFYTTGTTGLPKGVYFSHRQLVLHALAVRCALAGRGQGRLNDGDVYMPITPMCHVHAWGLPYVATSMGLRQVYPGRHVPDQLLTLMQREQVTFSHCVPTTLHMLLASAERQAVDLSGWTVIVGGAALPRPLCLQALAMGIDIFAGYGMSETGAILTLSQLTPDMQEWGVDAQAEVRCRAGRPIALVQLRIVDEAMNALPHDGLSAGEIIVRAPWLTQGYLKDPFNSEKLWERGWLHTGDIAVIGPDGYVRITDRLKDVIKTRGEWISSLDLEDLLLRHAAIVEAAVITVPDAKWSERPMAVVVRRPAQDVNEADLRAHLDGFVAKGLISKFGVPERIVFVDALPRTGVGKIDKRLLRARYGSQRDSRTIGTR